MTENENPQPSDTDDGVEGHHVFAGMNHPTTDEDDVEGHQLRRDTAPGVVTGALSPDDSLPSARRG